MIFLTVGTQLPFDRMVNIVKNWHENANTETKIFAQIGNTTLKPQTFPYQAFLNPQQYSEHFNEAELIVSHAGMGTIISSLTAGKPIIVFPRKASFGEHRNDHQIATCKKLSQMDGCYIAWDENELIELLNRREELVSGTINDKNINFANSLKIKIDQLF